MSYTSVEEIPFNVRLCYDEDDIIQWLAAYNNACDLIKDGTYTVPDYCVSDAMYAREIAFETCKYLPSSRFVECSATVEVVDRQGEVADVDSYLKASSQFIDRGGIGIEQHSSKVISVIWKAYAGVDEVTGKPAIFTCENYFRGTKLYDEAWEGVLNGALQEKSIGSRIDPKKTETECDEDGCHNRIYADQWFELSSVFRGANPRTYQIDKNEAIKGFGNTLIVDCNRNADMCPIKRNYLDFKADVLKIDDTVKAHYVSDGVMYIRGNDLSRFKGVISQHYPNMNTHDVRMGDVGEFTFIIDKTKDDCDDNFVFTDVLYQVDNERQAIAEYDNVKDVIRSSELSDEDKEMAIKVIDEIIGDEEKHIGGLIRLAELLRKGFEGNLDDGMRETDDVILKENNMNGGCPPGQHEHAGVKGCHDVMREHPFMENNNSDDVPNDSKMSIDELRRILMVQASILNQYPQAQVEEFLQSPDGKHFIEMYLLYQRMRRASDKTESSRMKEEVLKEEAPVVEEEKECKEDVALKEAIPDGTPATPMTEDADAGPIPEGTESAPPEGVPFPEAEGVEDLKADTDLPTAIANIASAIVFIKTKIETMCARLDGLEDMVKMQTEVKDVAEDVLSEVSIPIDEEVAEISPEKEESDAKSESVEEDKEKVESEDEPKEEEVKEEVVEEDVKDDKPEEEVKEDESKDEDKAESDDDKSEEEPMKEEDKVEEDVEKKKSDLTFDDIFSASSALIRRKEELREKGIDMDALIGNPASISAKPMTVTSVHSTVSIVNTPAPAPFTPAPTSLDEMRAKSFDKWMEDMQTLSAKQFSERIKGLVRQ